MKKLKKIRLKNEEKIEKIKIKNKKILNQKS